MVDNGLTGIFEFEFTGVGLKELVIDALNNLTFKVHVFVASRGQMPEEKRGNRRDNIETF